MKLTKFKYQGEEATVYLLQLDRSIKLNTHTSLPKGKYILKRYKSSPKFDLNELYQLSDLNLVPKVYYVGQNLVIMKYVQGTEMQDFIKKKHDLETKKTVFKNTVQLLMKWHKYNKWHCDLNFYNILVTKDLKVFFIDPMVNICCRVADYNQLSTLELKLGLRGQLKKCEDMLMDLERWKENGYLYAK